MRSQVQHCKKLWSQIVVCHGNTDLVTWCDVCYKWHGHTLRLLRYTRNEIWLHLYASKIQNYISLTKFIFESVTFMYHLVSIISIQSLYWLSWNLPWNYHWPIVYPKIPSRNQQKLQKKWLLKFQGNDGLNYGCHL